MNRLYKHAHAVLNKHDVTSVCPACLLDETYAFLRLRHKDRHMTPSTIIGDLWKMLLLDTTVHSDVYDAVSDGQVVRHDCVAEDALSENHKTIRRLYSMTRMHRAGHVPNLELWREGKPPHDTVWTRTHMYASLSMQLCDALKLQQMVAKLTDDPASPAADDLRFRVPVLGATKKSRAAAANNCPHIEDFLRVPVWDDRPTKKSRSAYSTNA